MKRSGILNMELSKAIAGLGHGDGLLVVDAGFPIPSDAWRIDLALSRDVPALRTVLELISTEMVVEGITVAEDVRSHNRPLYDWLGDTWAAIPLDTIPHAELLATAPSRAKAIVRTGAFEPWGNVLLRSGVDVPLWFEAPGVVVPDYYEAQMLRARGESR